LRDKNKVFFTPNALVVYGKFKFTARAALEVRNPKTGAEIQIISSKCLTLQQEKH